MYCRERETTREKGQLGRDERGREEEVERRSGLTVKGSTTPEFDPFVSGSTRVSRFFFSLRNKKRGQLESRRDGNPETKIR